MGNRRTSLPVKRRRRKSELEDQSPAREFDPCAGRNSLPFCHSPPDRSRFCERCIDNVAT